MASYEHVPLGTYPSNPTTPPSSGLEKLSSVVAKAKLLHSTGQTRVRVSAQIGILT